MPAKHDAYIYHTWLAYVPNCTNTFPSFPVPSNLINDAKLRSSIAVPLCHCSKPQHEAPAPRDLRYWVSVQTVRSVTQTKRKRKRSEKYSRNTQSWIEFEQVATATWRQAARNQSYCADIESIRVDELMATTGFRRLSSSGQSLGPCDRQKNRFRTDCIVLLIAPIVDCNDPFSIA